MPSVAETARLMSLRQLRLLDTPASESFDRITRTASLVFGLPYAAISLTDHDRQWFKSRVGIDPVWMARKEAPCSAVAETTCFSVIPDLAADAGFMHGELVRNGMRFYAGAPLVARDGHGLGALCVLGPAPRNASDAEMAALRDLAAMVMAQVELEHAFGRIDPISGLPNRAQFADDLLDLARNHPDGARVAILVDLADTAQLDNFARVMGYSHIDGMVKYAAGIIRERIGDARTAYHVSPTQIAFLAPVGVDLDDYVCTVTSALIRSRALSNFRFVATTLIGIAPFRLGTLDAGGLLRALHSAAQDARANGQPVSTYSASLDGLHRRRFQLLQDFGDALVDPGQLRLVFQPRIDLASQACVGAEALLRWTHPTLGNISPCEFIPIVEHSTHAREMTAWVVDTAVWQLSLWRREGIEVNLSLNISAANLQEEDFADRVAQILSRHGIAPQDIELEMTESAIMKDTGLALQQLNALARLGVRLAIDDFGTGYSSLAYLQRLPMQVVKIDQSFIRNIGTCLRERKLVESMIMLSRDLGLRVVAEGVETAEIAEILRGMACEEAQGYLFARPIEAGDFAAWYGDVPISGRPYADMAHA